MKRISPHPGCRFYGMNGMAGKLIPQGGNQCALIINSYSPCWMETEAQTTPDEANCPVALQLTAMLLPNEPDAKPDAGVLWSGRDRWMATNEPC